MGFFDNDTKLDKMITEQYPGKWEWLEISSENAHGQENSFICASKIAQTAKLVHFPILIGTRTSEAVSTDGSMWQILIRVCWPSGQNISNVMDVANIQHFDLGRLDIRQNTINNYSEALNICTALDWKNRKMRKVWRCNYKKDKSNKESEKNRQVVKNIRNTFEEYCKQIDDLIALLETEKYKYETDKCMIEEVKFVQRLVTNWKKGDTNALLTLQKIIRREVNTHNTGKDELQKLVLREMASNPQLSIEPLLSMIRDQDGKLAFPKDFLTYLHYPDRVLRTLQDFALSGFDTKKLIYEFIRIGTQLYNEVPNFRGGGSDRCAVSLLNIKRLIYNDDQTALFSSIPILNEDEKKYLIDHNYKIDN